MEVSLCGTSIPRLYCGVHMETIMVATGAWKKYRDGKIVIERKRGDIIDGYFSGLADDKVVS